MSKKAGEVVGFDGEEISVPQTRGPGFDHPLAVAARKRLENGQAGDPAWVNDVLSLTPEERIAAFGQTN